jgi:hypothetical protein
MKVDTAPTGLEYINDDNTVAWFRSDTLITKTSVTNKVTALGDATGNGNNLVQADTTKSPIWASTGITFNGTDQYMQDAFTLDQPCMIYIVFKQVTWTSNDYIFDGNTDVSGVLRQRTATPGLGITAGTSSDADNNLAVGDFGIVRVTFNTTDKLQVDLHDITISGNYGAADMEGFCLGANGASHSLFGNFEVKEIVIRNQEDDATTQTAIYNYLKTKYGL